MSDAVGNDLDREALGVCDRLDPGLAIAHDARQLESLRDPAAVFLKVQVNRQIHSIIILPHGNEGRNRCRSNGESRGPVRERRVHAHFAQRRFRLKDRMLAIFAQLIG